MTLIEKAEEYALKDAIDRYNCDEDWRENYQENPQFHIYKNACRNGYCQGYEDALKKVYVLLSNLRIYDFNGNRLSVCDFDKAMSE